MAPRALVAALLLLALAPAAPAAELYFALELGWSGGDGDSSGTNVPAGGSPYSGGDRDSSPVYGASVGIALPAAEALPWDLGDLAAIALRGELEGLTGRDYELLTDGAGAFDVRSEVDSSAVLANLWFDLPVAPLYRALAGHSLPPLLMPVTFSFGGGLGLAINEVKATDVVSAGRETSLEFAYQAGGSFGYRLNEHVTWSVGYRYVDLGETKQKLMNGGTASPFAIDLTAHEAMTTLRIDFWGVPIPRTWSTRW